ncbi:MAG: ABC transporter ATP-binding protein [Rhodospirillales bacterium]
MSTLIVRNLTKRFGALTVVDDFALSVRQGELVSLLGPSGCGKSTILRMIAGLLEPDEGQVEIAAKDVTWLPTHKRNIGLVFQSYALFPHMSVFENVAFGLRQRRVAEAELRERVLGALAMVRMEALAQRMPRELSGGQQQRVALARAVAPRPALLLLDEPLSNLDAKLRDSMRIEIRRLQQELSITTLFVTHDQEEALTMSDKICVLSEGRLQQTGTPREVYEHPATGFVAAFFGRSNVFSGRVGALGDKIRIDLGGGIEVLAASLPTGLGDGDAVAVTLRQESIAVTEGEAAGLDNVFAARLDLVSFAGAAMQFVLTLDNGAELSAELPAGRGRSAPAQGSQVWVAWSADDVIVTAAS